MIQLFHVTKHYKGCRALSDVSLRIEKGECVLLTGPSGAGKTTLLKLIFGAEIPDDGQILVQNRNIARIRQSVVPFLRRTMGFVLQDFKLLPRKTVFENVALPLIIRGFSSSGTKKKVNEALQAVGMEHKRAMETSVLSAGEQQRLCIARVLAVAPEVILMDEPCSALDPAATLQVEELMRELSKQYAIVIVTHNMQQAARVSDQTGLFWLGELIEYDETGKLFTRPEQKITEDYITGRMG